jgi:hypothetical protein
VKIDAMERSRPSGGFELPGAAVLSELPEGNSALGRAGQHTTLSLLPIYDIRTSPVWVTVNYLLAMYESPLNDYQRADRLLARPRLRA